MLVALPYPQSNHYTQSYDFLAFLAQLSVRLRLLPQNASGYLNNRSFLWMIATVNGLSPELIVTCSRGFPLIFLFSQPTNRTCLPCNALKEAFKVEFVIRAMQSLESLGLPLISDQSLKSKLISDAKFDFESYKAMLSLEGFLFGLLTVEVQHEFPHVDFVHQKLSCCESHFWASVN